MISISYYREVSSSKERLKDPETKETFEVKKRSTSDKISWDEK